MRNDSDSSFLFPTPTAPANLPEGGPPRTPRFLNIPPLVIDLEDPETRKDPYIQAILQRRGL